MATQGIRNDVSIEPVIEPVIEPATLDHLDCLLDLELRCFQTDRLSRRSMRRFLRNEQSVFLVVMQGTLCVGYLLILFHQGTRLSRLYSIAVDPQWRGKGIARSLMLAGEQGARDRGALYVRLEVNNANVQAIALYHSLGYREFGLIRDYYEDHSDALRMQKQIRHYDLARVRQSIKWYQQSTPFTCGPAALMMAMSSVDDDYHPSQVDELQFWREATTIFMTSGHGGCHPLGLALSAKKRGFNVEVWISQKQALFVEGVRSEKKKQIITIAHQEFVRQSRETGIKIHYTNIDQKTLIKACDNESVPIMLISTYRMDRKKTPHWVVVSGYDGRCFYIHDPDPDDKRPDIMDCQYLPIAQEDLDPMSSFGGTRLRTVLIISRKSD